jgi:coatomer subunit beta
MRIYYISFPMVQTCRRDPAQKSRFVRCLFQLLRSESQAVSYEAAWTLVSLSTAPTAVRACAQTYATLLTQSSDNNVKLIVLDRLSELKKHHTKVVQEILMDILRALSSPNIDICKKVLSLAIDMVGPRNIEEVMQVLKREVVRAQESDLEHGDEYKILLIQAIHRCATRYAEVADSVVLALLDFLGGDGGYDVMQCVKSIVEQYPNFRPSIVRKIIDNLDEITSADAMRVALWLLGEYSDSRDATVSILIFFELISCLSNVLSRLQLPVLVCKSTKQCFQTHRLIFSPIYLSIYLS